MKSTIGSVFISHSSREPDFSITKSLAESLEDIGVNVWWDKEGLEGGDYFPVEILEAIIRQHFFIFIVSNESIKSKWCLRELIRATELEKDIKPLLFEHIPKEKSPLELAGIQYVDISSGIQKSLPSILRALGIGETTIPNVLDDPFARDGRLIEIIADQLRYAKTFTDSLNLVYMLKNIGMKCSETDRAKTIFENMASLSLFSVQGGMRRIDYVKVRQYLLYEWTK
jgi:TIR domain-containing protein